MSRYIDAGSLLTKIKAYRPYMYLGEDALSYAIKMVELEPSADVVEVVRCKDCEHGQSYNMFGSRYCLKHNDVAVRDNDFCSYGERAEE